MREEAKKGRNKDSVVRKGRDKRKTLLSGYYQGKEAKVS